MGELCVEIANAYSRLHEQVVVHGDVHASNLIVNDRREITIIDFGLARRYDGLGETAAPVRGSAAYMLEPEYAQALLDGDEAPLATPAGEQYQVASLLYQLLTGATYIEFALESSTAMRQIVELPPVSFVDRALPPRVEVERVLQRALHKQPNARYATMRAFADALGLAVSSLPATQVDQDTSNDPPRSGEAVGQQSEMSELMWDGELLRNGIRNAPRASIAYGAAGVAYAFYRRALIGDDPNFLSLAEAWSARAASEIGRHGALFGDDEDLTEEALGRSSLYFSEPGVHLVRVLVANAAGDLPTLDSAARRFISLAEMPCSERDLISGSTGLLLGACTMLEAVSGRAEAIERALGSLSRRLHATLWSELREHPQIVVDAVFPGLGAAHGWGGVLLATLRWAKLSRRGVSEETIQRLRELAELGHPRGRGLRWRWRESLDDGEAFMSGWCNGSAGLIPLWLCAHEMLKDQDYLDLATAAGWHVWEDYESQSASLCCGFTGRAYSLLSLYRTTGDDAWLRRARTLSENAFDALDDWELETPSLLKGSLGPALLRAELRDPHLSRFPLVETDGFPPGS